MRPAMSPKDNLGQHYYYYPDDSISRVDTLGGTTTYVPATKLKLSVTAKLLI